ncbi:multidrug efflux pump acriflavin resistance protein AcrB/AcrD/AcrF [Acetobacter aceti NRIC 0242]|uniref:Transport system membrane protein n=1 Tax=Acetobacter aceti NBRC 14818 TaxID=887700 RepID=A0AB33IAW9_ACEAC|nr:MdtA/MuxA family multidrug efflux RND transporter periplasmic adaptor subunit [Acetobacter aceti]TCS34870.1 multidrug efflux system membrane fusion protein [Acetobacter aceti NBRC 14818]BCK74552.1 transport system membrane protein [Acetobacter aceti NBRC 14818]GAN56061.1 multidrug resistance efflux pump acriflavin resistance protein HlyD/AcrB/AcrD/AcrF [Acetobacter aceti NBRC 14818]GBO80098.1 multidrug efflux pump acriflavin resistance protein AcrB/AcrD/AcrF [Acetobacter aceti NRIC 0242]
MSEHNSSPAPSPSPSPRRSSRTRRWIWVILVLLLIGIVAYAFLSHREKTSRRVGSTTGVAQPVTVETVATGDMPVILTELGTVVPITNVTVQTRVEGYLMDVKFTEGQHVKKDDLLAIIDPRPYEVALHQYQGQLAQDQAQLERARIDNARYQKLIKQDSVAAMTARDQEFTVKQLEGTVKVDQALVDNQKLQLVYCHITAPVDGRVGIRAVDRGNYVTAGQSGGLAILTQMQPISVIFTLPQDQLPEVADQLRAGNPLQVEAWNSSNTQKIATGSVSSLDSQIDTATGTVRLRAIFPNEDEHLFPNQFVNARLLVKTLHNAIIVPSNALQTGPNGQFVYVVKSDNTVEVRNVKQGITNGTRTVVSDGLKPGDRVVTDGTDHLRAGAKVSIPADHPDTTKQQQDAHPASSHRHHNSTN